MQEIKRRNIVGKERMFDILYQPVVTEKTTLISKYRQYTFRICMSACKAEVKYCIENIFNVKIDSINISIVKGSKTTNRFKGVAGNHSSYKKAIATLCKGYSIDLSTDLLTL